MARFVLFLALAFTASLSYAALPEPSGLLPLQPMNTAPEAIRVAAQAIVLLETADHAGGTGFFIKDGGRLVTNSHVLGADNCTREGCYVDVVFSFEAGAKPEKRELYAVPLFNDTHWDISVFDVFVPTPKNATAQKFIPSHTLEFSTQNHGTLALSTPFVVGHPDSASKRWSSAPIYEIQGDWCRSGHCVLEGSSGSPVLDAEGKVLGLVHRSGAGVRNPFSLDQTFHSTHFSLATGFQTALNVIRTGKPAKNIETIPSIPLSRTISASDVEEASFVEPSAASLLSRKIWSLTIVGPSPDKNLEIPLMTLLKDECADELRWEEAINDPDYPYDSCAEAADILDCTETREGEEAVRCPEEEERAEWIELFNEVADQLELKSQREFLSWRIKAATLFEASKEKQRTAGRKELEKQITKYPNLSRLTLAPLVAKTANGRDELIFQGNDYWKLVTGFSSIPGYEAYADEIAYTLNEVEELSLVSKPELDQAYSQFLAHPRVPIGSKLELEQLSLSSALKEK